MRKLMTFSIVILIIFTVLYGCIDVSDKVYVKMQHQIYNEDTVVEIPIFKGVENEAIEKANDVFTRYANTYFEYANTEGVIFDWRCYPFETKDYISIVLTLVERPNVNSAGDVLTITYDKTKQEIVETEVALDMKGLSNETLLSKLIGYDNEKSIIDKNIDIVKLEIQGFRYKKNNEMDVYLKVTLDYTEDLGYIYDAIFVYSTDTGEFIPYDGLLPFYEEALEMNPPLKYSVVETTEKTT